MVRKPILTAILMLIAFFPAWAQEFRKRLPQDGIIYFLLPDRFDNGDPSNDRGGLTGDRLRTGFDPTSKAFYNGGDLKGLIRRLDYIQSLGATAIWLGPIFKNKPVQGPRGQESAAYHGYWITDFTTVDPHLGTEADFRALVDAAHGRGIKLYMDIIANHTADVILYQECANNDCAYRSKADYPYSRRSGLGGAEINSGFAGDEVRTAENFARLTIPDYAYSVVVKSTDRKIKSPEWLNNPLYYHNRGNSTFAGESSRQGDFSGLDDLMTESPRVVAGMIDIYGAWVDRFGVDGFRIDTAKHVNPEFWVSFTPAILARARDKGVPHFHIFGEVAQDTMGPGTLAVHTREDKLPSVLDFGFQVAVLRTVAGSDGTVLLAKLFQQDALYAEPGAIQLPTFISNHDAGRFAWFARQSFPNATDAEVLARVKLGYSMLLLLRGVPTIYSGDEQGFAGSGDDQGSRQTLFGSRVAEYSRETLVGTVRTTTTDNFGSDHQLFQHITNLAKLRRNTLALRRGQQMTRASSDKPGIFAVSRLDPESDAEILIAFNTSSEPLDTNVTVLTRSLSFRALYGNCPETAAAPGSARLTLPAFGAVACIAEITR